MDAPVDGMGDVPPMGEPEMDNMGGSGDDTLSLFNQLTDTDKKAARSYIESMLSRDEQNSAPEQPIPNQGMPMESVIVTKKQLKKMNEEFGANALSSDKDKEQEKSEKKLHVKSTDSPFTPPKFQ